jgi:transposase
MSSASTYRSRTPVSSRPIRRRRLLDGHVNGKVEALVKYSRANFLTPVPHAASFDALNATLEERCRARQAERALLLFRR